MKQLFENELYTKPFISIGAEKPFPLHYHRHLELLYVLSGQINIQIGSQVQTLTKGQLLFATPYVVHGYMETSQSDTLLTLKILLEPECLGLLGTYFLEHHPANHIFFHEQVELTFPNAANRLISLCEQFSQNSKDTLTGYFELFCFFRSILSLTKLEKNNKLKETVYSRAIRCCCDNYLDEDFDTKKLTEMLFVSRSYLQQLFKKNLNLGIMEYVTLLRISKAENYLCETSLNISDICFRCGYSTVRSFNRAFMKIHGITPSQYREKHKQISHSSGRRILSNFDLFYGENFKK